MEIKLRNISHVKGKAMFTVGNHNFSQEEFASSFILSFCVTVYKYQGCEISGNYNIYDTNRMDKKQLYTALSRTTQWSSIHLDESELLRGYTVRKQPELELVNSKHNKNGKIYEITFSNELYYIGSTCESRARLTGHKNNKKRQVFKHKKEIEEISPIGNCPCNGKKELEEIESSYIREASQNMETGY